MRRQDYATIRFYNSTNVMYTKVSGQTLRIISNNKVLWTPIIGIFYYLGREKKRGKLIILDYVLIKFSNNDNVIYLYMNIGPEKKAYRNFKIIPHVKLDKHMADGLSQICCERIFYLDRFSLHSTNIWKCLHEELAKFQLLFTNRSLQGMP